MRTPLKILIAEDEALNALALWSQLEALGHSVIGPAKTGKEAVEIARTGSVDLCILDMRMPELSGIEAAEEIMRTQPVPIILLSGYSEPDLAIQTAHIPIYHYLIKPVTMEDLAPAIGVAWTRFEEWQRFRAEAEFFRRKIDERKLLERAKAILMEAQGLSERQAYRLLQQESQRRSLPMVEIARTILTADDLLRDHAPS